jgi:hypothetical protein
MKPGDLVSLKSDVPGLVLHSDWCWQRDDSGCHEVVTVRPGPAMLVLAIVPCGWPQDGSKQVLVLAPNGRFGWNSPVYFKEAT